MTLQRKPADLRSKLDPSADLHRGNLLTFLRSDILAWKDYDHPELAAETAAWIRSLRRESDARLKLRT